MDHRIPHPDLYNVSFTLDDFHGMPYRPLGKSGLRASSVGLGAWKIGYPETGDGARVDEKTAFAIFDRAIELGVTFWDTANRYNAASGNSERVIGVWLSRNADQRRNIVLATKVYGGMDGRTPNHSGLSRGNILDSVYACLERLQVDVIDLLYFHSFDSHTPVEESLCAIEDLTRQDLVRYFGVSNFTTDQLALYQASASSLSPRCRLVAVQNQFDMLRGESASHPGVLDYAARTGISFIAWSPLALGLLTDRYLDLSKVGKGDRLFDEGALAAIADERTLARLRQLAALARQWGMELAQLALVYMLGLPGMGPAIPSASTVKQLESNAVAGKITFNDEQRRQIREVLQ